VRRERKVGDGNIRFEPTFLRYFFLVTKYVQRLGVTGSSGRFVRWTNEADLDFASLKVDYEIVSSKN
jgi:hypothetical protein